QRDRRRPTVNCTQGGVIIRWLVRPRAARGRGTLNRRSDRTMPTRRMQGFASSLLGLSLLIASSPAPVAQVPRDAPRNRSGTGPAVRGRVVASDTGTPVTDARIAIRSVDNPGSTK